MSESRFCTVTGLDRKTLQYFQKTAMEVAQTEERIKKTGRIRELVVHHMNDRASGAIVAGDVELLRRLLDAGLDPNLKKECETLIKPPPLYMAVTNGEVEMMELLLDKGADPSECLYFC